MPHFCIWEHPQYRIVRVDIRSRAPNPRKFDADGFALRLTAQITDAAVPGAEATIEMIDDAMGTKTKGSGVYQASYADVRATYEGILGNAPKPKPKPPLGRALAGLLGVSLLFASCLCLVWGTIIWMVICIFRDKGGLTVMAESAVMWSIFDWRKTALKLLNYAWKGHYGT